jgi:hypothetical protein
MVVRIKGEILKKAPKNCTYVLDSLNRIMLVWTSQEKDTEVEGYNIYRIGADGEKEKLNNQLIPYNRNYFVDEKNNGKKEFTYEIESVSITNTPSLNRATVKVGKRKSSRHLILSLNRTANGIKIEAVPMTENNIHEILILKQVNSGNPKQIASLQPNNIHYIDTKVNKGELYNYSAIAVYKDKSQELVNSGVVIRY